MIQSIMFLPRSSKTNINKLLPETTSHKNYMILMHSNFFKNANKITSTHLQSTENISVREINCTIYSIAISYKEIMDDITTSKQENGNRKQEKPKQIVNLENDVERIRTEIAYVQVIINCKNKEKFKKHQNTMLHRLTKK